MPCRMFISIGTASETCAPASLTFCQPRSDIPVMWMNRLSGPSPSLPLSPPWPWASRSKVGRMPNGERMCAAIWRPELASDLPGLLVARKVDLAAHDHGDELVARGEPLLLDADRVVRILVAGNASRALEIAEGGAAARIHDALDRGVGVLGRVMDLRDVVHRRDAVVELAERAEQLVDVHVLRPVHGGERQENVLEVGDVPARRAGQEQPVGEEAAQRRLELVMVRIDEAGHDDAAAGVDHRRRRLRAGSARRRRSSCPRPARRPRGNRRPSDPSTSRQPPRMT